MQTLFPAIEQYVGQLSPENIPTERIATLQPLIDFIRNKKAAQQPVQLNFICTHNSRRSIFSQVWAQAMAHRFAVLHVSCYSGGTEATRIAPWIIETLQQVGFTITTDAPDSSNPLHHIAFAEEAAPVQGFSKKYNDPFNPARDFAAIMTCSEADAGCPIVHGAALRIPITYADPKVYDATPEAAVRYAERCLQIATEMHYIFSRATD